MAGSLHGSASMAAARTRAAFAWSCATFTQILLNKTSRPRLAEVETWLSLV